MRVIMKSLNGWQIVALVGLFLGTLVALVAMGQEIGALVAAAVAILAALGFNGAQNAINLERTTEVRTLANGNNNELRKQLEEKEKRHNDQIAELMRQIQATNEKLAATAAYVAPEQASDVQKVLNGRSGSDEGTDSSSR